MRLRELELFLDLLATKSLTQSAERLGMSQPNASHLLSRLEEKGGSKLFDRSGKRLLPLSSALFLEPRAKEIVRLWREAQEELLDQSSLCGELRIAATHTIGEYLLPEILFEFRQTHPKVHLQARIHNTAECLEALLGGEVEQAFIEGEVEDNQGLMKRFLRRDELAVVTSDEGLAARARYIDELFDRPWILREKGSGMRDAFLREVVDVKETFPLFLELDRSEAIKRLIQSHGALGCLSLLSVQREIKEGRLFRVEIIGREFWRHFYEVRREGSLGRLAKVFGEFVSVRLSERD